MRYMKHQRKAWFATLMFMLTGLLAPSANAKNANEVVVLRQSPQGIGSVSQKAIRALANS